VKLDRFSAVLIFLGIFALVNTILAVYLNSSVSGVANCTIATCENHESFAILYTNFSVPLSIVSWLAFGFGLALWKRSNNGNVIRFSMSNAGFDRSVYDLMVKMRGSGSRLSLLHSLVQAPHHRNELSEMTGIDWKEVDRQLRLLERYEFVSVETQAGPIKIYKLTDQGRSLLKLMDEIGKQS
jgi:DNA-binding HxlR family transcriptional regulator